MNGCRFCTVTLSLHVSCNESGTTMMVTSNHLEVVPQTDSGVGDAFTSDGEELSKRPDNFGQPVGKDEPGVEPILICKMRKGMEIRARCIAKKVRKCEVIIPIKASDCVDFITGYCKRTR